MTDQYRPVPPTRSVKATHDKFDRELAEMTRSIERRGNGPAVAEAEPVKQGVAEELANFIEKHADEMLKEAQQHRDDAYVYAKEIRDRTAEQLARLQAFTDSIKASQAEMTEVRMRFLRAGTSNDGGGVAKTPKEDGGQEQR